MEDFDLIYLTTIIEYRLMNSYNFQEMKCEHSVLWIKIEIMGEIILNWGKIFGNLMPISYFGFLEFSVRM